MKRKISLLNLRHKRNEISVSIISIWSDWADLHSLNMFIIIWAPLWHASSFWLPKIIWPLRGSFLVLFRLRFQNPFQEPEIWIFLLKILVVDPFFRTKYAKFVPFLIRSTPLWCSHVRNHERALLLKTCSHQTFVEHRFFYSFLL